MKKITKIYTLILFILLILFITTPNVINAYCVQGNTMNFGGQASYHTVGSREVPGPYAGGLPEGFDNDYAKAYIMTAEGYSEEEKQEALYAVLGDEEGLNDDINRGMGQELYAKAMEYQNKLLSQDKELITLTKDKNAKTTLNGNNLIYGPIYITYPMGNIETRRDWGGFYYAFFDENGNNISSKIQLCTLENGAYKQIAIAGNKNGYNKVTSGSYSGSKLYIVTTDRYITKVYMKAYSFQIVKRATIIRSEGTATVPGGTWYCGKVNKITKSGSGTSVPSGAEETGRKWLPGWTERIPHSWTKGKGGIYTCTRCGLSGTGMSASSCKEINHAGYWYYYYTYTVEEPCKGCSKICYSEKGHSYRCGQAYSAGTYVSQAQERIQEHGEEEEVIQNVELPIELGATIEVTKEWKDYDNQYGIRPASLHFNVYRSTDKANWEKLTENSDYMLTIENKQISTWKILITGLIRVDDRGRNYYFKVEEQAQHYYNPAYPGGTQPVFKDNPAYGYLTIENKLKTVNIGGYVWLDGQTGIKPAIANNGKMENSETKMANIVVHLYQEKPKAQYGKPLNQAGQKVLIETTVTDQNGYYEFKNKEIGLYYVEFDYDGIHYEDTIKVSGGSSKAFEDISNGLSNANRRNVFNSRFQTITYKKSNDGTNLNYKYENKKSILITNEDGKTTIKPEFKMTSESAQTLIKENTRDINLGLVKRGTDIALSTDVNDAKVTINGQATEYTYNKENNSIEIGQEESQEKAKYNLNLYASDYNYRIRDYVNTQNFQEKDYINEGNSGIKTGEALRVYVTYKLNLQNQSTKTMQINEVKYQYDEKYTFVGFENNNYAVQNAGNMLTINLNGLSLAEGETKTIYLVFEVKKADNTVLLGNFQNKAEITSYSNSEGLIDEDSQPGNFVNNNEKEDDSDTAGGITIQVPENQTRKITGKVFDKEGKNINDVIVQLIELKTVNGKTYEYIWEETVSGTDKGLKLNADGSKLEEYKYNKAEGYYEFQSFIPGDYIVRFIYGDGTTYDMTEKVIKYNGQDYKSMVDPNYKAEWYNSSSYNAGSTVARDNEARRLETMAYAVEIDVEKGLLLKLLDNKELNETEKEVLITTYNKLYDPDISKVTQEAINKLLKEEVLKNTWMCAETSKIRISVDTKNIAEIKAKVEVSGTEPATYKNTIENINLGLEQRPKTQIELKKYITGFKLTTSSGQTLVNATVDVNEYLTKEYAQNPLYINNKVQGLKDNVTILNTVWQYEVAPTEINTIVDGANLEFEYTLVVKNTGDTDYLSTELANAYKNSDIGTYKNTLTNKAAQIKGYMRNGSYNTQIGNSVGSSYYKGGNGQAKVLTEVTNIRDYINNDLTFVPSGNVAIDETAPKTHRILRDDYSMQEANINTILKTTQSTGKLENTGNAVMYKVILGKKPISSTGNLNFENYIAEVMSYTNAAGRRAFNSAPGNAEIIDHEHREGRAHEIDEADTGRIQIGAATGDDQTINYIIIIGVAAGLALVAIVAYVVKKYFLK